MEIFVDGIGKKYVTPDEVIVNLYFKAKGNSREEVIEKGLNNVATFTNVVLCGIKLPNDSLMTRNFSINEDRIYNEETRKYEVSGYVFNQYALLKMDYNDKLLSEFLNLTSSLENTPEINFQFGLKDESKCISELIGVAYNDALEKAKVLASVSGKKLKDSVMLELKNNYNMNFFRSESNFDSGVLKTMSANNIDTSYINPEDIEISVVVATKWDAN